MQPSMPFESKVEMQVMMPDRNVASVKVLKSSSTLDVYQVSMISYYQSNPVQ